MWYPVGGNTQAAAWSDAITADLIRSVHDSLVVVPSWVATHRNKGWCPQGGNMLATSDSPNPKCLSRPPGAVSSYALHSMQPCWVGNSWQVRLCPEGGTSSEHLDSHPCGKRNHVPE